MDAATLSATVETTWDLLQPYLPIIAAKAAEKVGSELPTAVGKLWQSIGEKFNTKATAKEAMDDLLNDPEEDDLQAAFRVQLKKALKEDEVFAGTIQSLLSEAGREITSYHAEVKGGGAIAQGAGAKAVGEGGIMQEGGVKGDFVVGGEEKEHK
jgi:hypothetical protein